MEHESDGETHCNWCARYNHPRIVKETGGTGNKNTSGDRRNDINFKTDHNTEKSPGDLKRLTVTLTPAKGHHLMLV